MELDSLDVFFVSNDNTYSTTNKLTYFSNILPSQLTCNYQTEKWQMALQRVVLDMSFALTDMSWAANSIAVWYEVGYGPKGKVPDITNEFAEKHPLPGLRGGQVLSSVLLLENVPLSDIDILLKLNEEFGTFRGLEPRRGRMLRQHANLQFKLDRAGFVVIIIPRYMKFKIGRPILFALGFREYQLKGMLKTKRWIASTDNQNYIIHQRRTDGTTRLRAGSRMNVSLLGPDFLNIWCDAITPNISTKYDEDKCLYSSECGTSLSRGSKQLEPKHLRYHDLLNSATSNFTFAVLGDQGHPLPIAFGQSTILQARFRKVVRTMNVEHIVRISTADDKSQQCIIADRFTVQLSSKLQLVPLEKWKIALLDFSYPVAFNHINKICRKRAGRMWLQEAQTDFFIPFRVRKLHWSSEQSMVDDYNIMLHKAKTTLPIGIFAINDQGYVSFTFMNQGTIQFDSSLLMSVGATLEQIEKHEQEGYVWFENGEEVVGQKQILFKNKADRFANVPHSLIIYTNIAAPSAIGSKLTKVLSVLHLSLSDIAEKEGRYHTIEPEHLNYVRLAYSDIESLEFNIRDVTGNVLNMRTDCRRPIVFTLSIKKFP